jgi:hypothetical protein
MSHLNALSRVNPDRADVEDDKRQYLHGNVDFDDDAACGLGSSSVDAFRFDGRTGAP